MKVGYHLPLHQTMVDFASNLRESERIEARISDWNVQQRVEEVNAVEELELCLPQLNELLHGYDL